MPCSTASGVAAVTGVLWRGGEGKGTYVKSWYLIHAFGRSRHSCQLTDKVLALTADQRIMSSAVDSRSDDDR